MEALLDRMRESWEGLNDRERRMVAALGFLLAVFVLGFPLLWIARENGDIESENEAYREVLAELEDKKLGLEPAIARYQEGIELLKGCHSQLAGFRARVEELTRDAEGGLRPFAEDPDAPGDESR